MDVSYRDHDLRELCESERAAKRALGAGCARKLVARVADLKAASSVFKLPAGKPHPLKGNRTGQYAIGLANGVRLIIEPNHKPVPKEPDGGTNWRAVTKVIIIEIGNYHD